MTRAKKRLYLFSARDRGDGFKRPPCQFALELPEEYVERWSPGQGRETHTV
jgi:superfamily I DNA/RNA helicase